MIVACSGTAKLIIVTKYFRADCSASVMTGGYGRVWGDIYIPNIAAGAMPRMRQMARAMRKVGSARPEI